MLEGWLMRLVEDGLLVALVLDHKWLVVILWLADGE